MGKVISLSAELKCGAQRAFEMFTVDELLASWLCDKADVDSREGGKFELFWNPPPENVGTVGCKVTGIQRNKFVSFDWKGPTMFDGFMNKADPLTHVVVFFVPDGGTGASHTFVHLIHSGWGRSSEWEEARQWFEEAWDGALSKLEKKIETGEL